MGKIALLLIGLLVLVASASAAGEVPDHLEISSSNEWIVANGLDSATITVRVLDAGNNSIQGATVTIQNLNTSLGSLSGNSFTTGVLGEVYPKFTANTISGAAHLRIRASSWVNGTEHFVIGTYIQYIDHSTPYRYSFILYNKTAFANSVTPITVRMLDRYGNTIDNRRESYYGQEAEKVQFAVSSPEDGARFLNGTTQIVKSVDANGNSTVQLRVSPYAGDNIVLITPQVSTVPSVWITIAGIGADPAVILASIVPSGNPPTLVAGPTSEFTILYTVLDAWGNPSAGESINITTEFVGEPVQSSEHAILTPTDMTGRYVMTYGPKTAAVIVNISAVVVGFPDVYRYDTVQFVNSTDLRLSLTASPNPIPSWDVPGNVTADIIAKVVDEYGNPVQGQNITFWIESTAYDGVSEQAKTSDPLLQSTHAISDEFGYAVVRFQPSAFLTNAIDPTWVEKATASCIIKAKGATSSTESVTAIFKNYPYLNVDLQINPLPVYPGQEFNVIFTLEGDGWALRPRPIDTVLSMGRGFTMLKDDYDRILQTRPAAKVFNSKMVPNYDRVGLWTFGDIGWADLLGNPSIKNEKYLGDDNDKTDDPLFLATYYPGNNRTYSDHATRDHALTGFLSSVDAEIDRIMPFTEETEVSKGQPIRYGLYRSITDLIDNGRPSAIKAVIVLVDMDWDWFGDPIASGGVKYYPADNPEQMVSGGNWMAFPLGGPYTGHWDTTNYSTKTSWQNMSNYARDNKIKIFTITYSSDVTSSAKTTLSTLATGTGGFHRHAATEEELIDIYEEIADVLKTEAGVNTTMNIQMGNLKVNNITMAGDDIFTYIYAPGSNNAVTREGNSTKMWYYNLTRTKYYNDTYDQTNEWTSGHSLNFNLGTIHLNETWEIQYRLRVNESVCGEVQVFENTSSLIFNDGADHIALPSLSVNVPCNLTSPINVNKMQVDITSAGLKPDFIETVWDFTYTGNKSISQTLSYQYQDPATGIFGDWVEFDWRTGSANATLTSKLPINNLPYGNYIVKVFTREDVAGGVTAQDEATVPYLSSGKNYIRLK